MQPRSPAFLAIVMVCLASPAMAASPECTLLPLEQQLLSPVIRSDTPQYAETNYRKQLLRFVNSYYSNLAEDLLRGQGEYLTSLHRLMGSEGATCTATYRDMLLAEYNSQYFGLALWTMRSAPVPSTAQVTDSKQAASIQ